MLHLNYPKWLEAVPAGVDHSRRQNLTSYGIYGYHKRYLRSTPLSLLILRTLNGVGLSSLVGRLVFWKDNSYFVLRSTPSSVVRTLGLLFRTTEYC